MNKRAPAYVVEFDPFARINRLPWLRACGRPTDANLAKYVAGLIRSTSSGGANDHCEPFVVRHARIVRQGDDKTMATWRAEN